MDKRFQTTCTVFLFHDEQKCCEFLQVSAQSVLTKYRTVKHLRLFSTVIRSNDIHLVQFSVQKAGPGATIEFSSKVVTEFNKFSRKKFIIKTISTCSVLCKTPRFYHRAIKTPVTDSIFKLTLIHASVISYDLLN